MMKFGAAAVAVLATIALACAPDEPAAERLDIDTLLTLDERDFRAVKPRTGPFRLLPADL